MYSQSHINLKTVAIFSDNKAFSSLVHMILAKNIQLRVRKFTSEDLLKQYINITPIDLLIYDCEQIDEKIITSIQNIKEAKNTKFQTIALCKIIPKGIRSICKSIGIDELIIKPMSPSYLEARVNGRVNQNITDYPTTYLKKSTLEYTNLNNKKTRRKTDKCQTEKPDNVIFLFGENNSQTSPSQKE